MRNQKLEMRNKICVFRRLIRLFSCVEIHLLPPEKANAFFNQKFTFVNYLPSLYNIAAAERKREFPSFVHFHEKWWEMFVKIV